MIPFEAHPSRVPDQLYPLMDDQFMQAQERWQRAETFEQAVPQAPELFPVAISDTENVRIAGLRPIAEADGSVVALSFPFQQGLNKTMIMRAAFMQESVMPQSEVLLLPNVHGGKNATFSLQNSDKSRLKEGSLAPIAEKFTRAMEVLGVSTVALTGYSQGARMSLDIAAANPEFDVTHINMDEMPTAPNRDAKQLQKDFMRSGALGAQRKSMSEAGFGVLLDETARLLPVDYAKFGLGTLRQVSRLLHQGMTGSVAQTLQDVTKQRPFTQMKIGVVEGSYLTDASDLEVRASQRDRIRGVRYTGDAANAHTTGDNYAAHALMVKDGLQ